ncbi:hypothetical protein C2G38_1636339 [Gigaspora rosea]|uniref:Uncharacterized protein n=1 Tax=Gigaspora rosea TaxID=44941 RepID=A0A397UZ72_9GLOM|nr:hypothetical protein C2G38_1636339 [Gigaspora rosea]
MYIFLYEVDKALPTTNENTYNRLKIIKNIFLYEIDKALPMTIEDIYNPTNPNKHVELLIGEIKPPNTRDALVSDDLVFLGKMMKCSLDKTIEDYKMMYY